MSDNKNIKQFSAEDIERYQQGLMSAQERNALEKAALNDPFLSDALEGFMDTPVPVTADIDELKVRLGKRLEEKTKLVTLAPKKSNWSYLKIAAVLMIMIGAGWFFYQYSGEGRNNTPIAVNDNKSTPDSTVVIAEPTATPVKENNEFKKDTSIKRPAPSKSPSNSYTWENDQSRSKDKPSTLSQADLDSRKNDEIAENKDREMEGRKLDLAADQKEKAIAKTEASSDSIVVSGYGAKKMAVPAARSYRDNINSIAVPVKGWEQYRKYLKDSLRTPSEQVKNSTEQFVELNFEVDQAGKPYNYKIISSFSNAASEEAWRLVSQGPLWTPGKASLKIYF